MENPFKFGTIVDNEYFTDRVEEQIHIKALLDSPNHLVLISPRRFGKSSLVRRAALQTGRPIISLNMQQVMSTEELASVLLKGVFKLHPWERVKHSLASFRVVPTISLNPMGDAVDISFQPSANTNTLLEDAFSMVEKLSDEKNRIIVIFDEFQELIDLEKGLDKKLRAIMQEQKKINYVFMGSEESMMSSIFENKKSSFYHFGELMRLKRIPYDDFKSYVGDRLNVVMGNVAEKITKEILEFTKCHPYYTQQLAFIVWESSVYRKIEPQHVMDFSINAIIQTHDLDYERMWMSVNKTDKKVLRIISRDIPLYEDRKNPSSTVYSSVKKLLKKGLLIKQDGYEMEDPFFKRWINIQNPNGVGV